MSEEEFREHVEALATKRLEKPKKLSARNGRYWSEILSQHYNFHRDNLEVSSGTILLDFLILWNIFCFGIILLTVAISFGIR